MHNSGYHKGANELILNLPVYNLCGGTEEYRKQFLKRLIAALDRYQICVKLIRYENASKHATIASVKQFDLVLIDRIVDFPVRKIVFEQLDDIRPGDLYWNGGDDFDLERFVEKLVGQLWEILNKVPVWACILIGGKSSRMGHPKHLLPCGDELGGSWLERTVELIHPMVDGIVVSGDGILPESCCDLIRLPDVAGVEGPMSGLLAATRWNPLVNWLAVACDMPQISRQAIKWLMSVRRPGSWGRVPRLADSEFCEPLLAMYDFRAAQLFEEQLVHHRMRVGDVARHFKVDNPIIPESLRSSWQNINTPEQLKLVDK